MRTIDRIAGMIRRYVDDPDVRDLDALLADIMKTLRQSRILVQDLGDSGLHAELHESNSAAVNALARYVKREWSGRDGPGDEVPIPGGVQRAIDIYYNPNLGGRENYEQYDIIPI